MMRKLLSLYPSGRMNAATPDGAPLWRIDDQKIFKKNSLPRRASKEALRRGSIIYITIFMVCG